MAPVFARLNDLGIEPLGPSEFQANGASATVIVERVRRRAEALRAQWLAEEVAADSVSD
jgi:hypothetical protein